MLEKGQWHDEARKMREEGATYTQIAKRFGVSVPAAYYAVNPDKRKQMTGPRKKKNLPETDQSVIGAE